MTGVRFKSRRETIFYCLRAINDTIRGPIRRSNVSSLLFDRIRGTLFIVDAGKRPPNSSEDCITVEEAAVPRSRPLNPLDINDLRDPFGNRVSCSLDHCGRKERREFFRSSMKNKTATKFLTSTNGNGF